MKHTENVYARKKKDLKNSLKVNLICVFVKIIILFIEIPRECKSNEEVEKLPTYIIDKNETSGINIFMKIALLLAVNALKEVFFMMSKIVMNVKKDIF